MAHARRIRKHFGRVECWCDAVGASHASPRTPEAKRACSQSRLLLQTRAPLAQLEAALGVGADDPRAEPAPCNNHKSSCEIHARTPSSGSSSSNIIETNFNSIPPAAAPIKCARRFLCTQPLTALRSLLPLLLNPLQSFRRPLTQILEHLGTCRQEQGKGAMLVHCNTVYNNAISIERPAMPPPPHELGQNDVHRINQMAPPHAL